MNYETATEQEILAALDAYENEPSEHPDVLRLVSADYLRWGEGEHSLRELRATT